MLEGLTGVSALLRGAAGAAAGRILPPVPGKGLSGAEEGVVALLLLLLVEQVDKGDGAARDQGDDEDDEEDVEEQGRDVQVLGGGAVAERPAVVAEDFAIPGLGRPKPESVGSGLERGGLGWGLWATHGASWAWGSRGSAELPAGSPPGWGIWGGPWVSLGSGALRGPPINPRPGLLVLCGSTGQPQAWRFWGAPKELCGVHGAS